MRIRNLILRDPGDDDSGGGGGGGDDNTGNEFVATLPEDLRKDPSLQDFKDVASLAKSYVHARSMIGSDKISKPAAGWQDEQWGEFYRSIGRPDSPELYQLEKETIPEGIEIDEERLGEAKATLHAAGLTNKQANKVMGHYFESIKRQQDAVEGERQAMAQAQETKLRKEWGENYAGNMEVVKGVLGKFGDDALLAWLKDDQAVGNSPLLSKFMFSIGQAMLDDSASSLAEGVLVTNQSRAAQEIKQLENDPMFMKQYLSRGVPGHDEAVDRMLRLQRIAAGEIR
jgi:hypothetical protein